MPAHNRHTTDVNANRGRESPSVIFKASPAEKRAITANAKRFGITTSQWCRYRALTDGPASKGEIRKLREADEL